MVRPIQTLGTYAVITVRRTTSGCVASTRFRELTGAYRRVSASAQPPRPLRTSSRRRSPGCHPRPREISKARPGLPWPPTSGSRPSSLSLFTRTSRPRRARTDHLLGGPPRRLAAEPGALYRAAAPVALGDPIADTRRADRARSPSSAGRASYVSRIPSTRSTGAPSPSRVSLPTRSVNASPRPARSIPSRPSSTPRPARL